MKIAIIHIKGEDGLVPLKKFHNELNETENFENEYVVMPTNGLETASPLPDVIDYVIVSLGVAGITAFYKFLCKYLERHQHRSISLSVENRVMKITGHSQKEELEILEKIASEKESS